LGILNTVLELELPDCHIAAGFIRNMIWDYLHGFESTPLNDVDVIYFDKRTKYQDDLIQETLNRKRPDVNWEVKNQAFMHSRNGDSPYLNSKDAMSYWPEKETAIGIALKPDSKMSIIAPFGLELLFNGKITHNPKRSQKLFLNRVHSKGWLNKWPKLKLSY